MTTQLLPSIPHGGSTISPTHGIHPPSSTYKDNISLPDMLKRRPHTRRLQAVPSSDLPPVVEEDEGDLADKDEPKGARIPRQKRRPKPLIPLRSCTSSDNTPLILEIPDASETFKDRVTKVGEPESFILSPSTLFARRRSETTLDFPLPPTRAPLPSTFKEFFHSLSTTAPPRRHSPTPSHNSLTSTSSTDGSSSSSSSPVTPASSEKDDDDDNNNHDFRSHPAKENDDDDLVTIEDFAQVLDPRFARSFGRSASVVSLRSFGTAEFDAQVEPIYRMMDPPKQTPPPVPVVPVAGIDPVVQNARVPKEECLQVPTQDKGRSPCHVLSVLDTTHGGSFDVPLVLGSFLSPPSSPCSPNSDGGDGDESDYEGIPIFWSDSESDDGPFGAALSSSEDEMSDDDDDDDDDDEAPSRALDPVYRTSAHSHRSSSDRGDGPQLPPFQRLEPIQLNHDNSDTGSVYSMTSASQDSSSDTASVYSTASHSSVPEVSTASLKAPPRKWSHDRPLPRESLVPSDVFASRISSTCLTSSSSSSSHRRRSPSSSSQTSEVCSRFSTLTTTLASIPDPPTSFSSKQAFFSRLTIGRTKPPLPLPPLPMGGRGGGGRIPFSPTQEYHQSLMTSSSSNSARKRTHVLHPPHHPLPPLPALSSAFSFSTRAITSHSSIYRADDNDGSGSSGSCRGGGGGGGFSGKENSHGSMGLRRPPVPIEFFGRG